MHNVVPFCKQTAGPDWCFKSLNSELLHILVVYSLIPSPLVYPLTPLSLVYPWYPHHLCILSYPYQAGPFETCIQGLPFSKKTVTNWYHRFTDSSSPHLHPHCEPAVPERSQFWQKCHCILGILPCSSSDFCANSTTLKFWTHAHILKKSMPCLFYDNVK